MTSNYSTGGLSADINRGISIIRRNRADEWDESRQAVR